jgi:hypothetical protein
LTSRRRHSRATLVGQYAGRGQTVQATALV